MSQQTLRRAATHQAKDMTSTTTDPGASSPVVMEPPGSRGAWLRWGFGFAITFSLLLVAPTRLTVVWMAHSAREPRLAWLFVISLAVTVALTWNLAETL